MQKVRFPRPLPLAIAAACSGAAFAFATAGCAHPAGADCPIRAVVASDRHPRCDHKVVLQENLSRPEFVVADNALPLEETLWHLASYANADGETVAARPFNQPPSLQFRAGQASGNATCNRFFGSYRLTGDELALDSPIGSTLMACPDEFATQERAVLTALEQVARYAIAEDELRLLDAKGNTLLTYTRVAPAPLAGTLWQLSAYNNGRGGVISLVAGSIITATFDENGGLTGFAGCNNYIAPYETTGETLDIGLGISTRKFCSQPEGVMDQESAYLQALQIAATYRIAGNELLLRTADGALVARFRTGEESDGS